MEQLTHIFTIFFMLLGPIKIIPAFAALTQGTESRFKRDVAVRGAVIASVLCAFIALAGRTLLGRFYISLESAQIAGGLVLLLAAFQIIFRKAPATTLTPGATAMQLAVSPVAVPVVVPQAGVAAILICVMLAPQYQGGMQAVAVCLAIIMVLDFLVMYFIDWVMKTPGLMMVLTVLGAVLIFVQVCLAIETILKGLRGSGVVGI